MKPRHNDTEMLGFGPFPFRLWKIVYVTRDPVGDWCHDTYLTGGFFRVGTSERHFFHAAGLVARLRNALGRQL